MTGCAVAGEDAFSVEDQALTDQAIVDLVNGPDASFEFLRDQVMVGTRAAQYLSGRVRGADGLYGTIDDDPVSSVAEIDAVPYVGPTAMQALRSYAITNTMVVVETVVLTDSQAAAIVALVNTESTTRLVGEVGLTTTAANHLVAERPYADILEVADVYYVGKTTLEKLRAYVSANPTPTCTGGTFDGVAFTANEACRAIEFANKARYSQMGSISPVGRAYIYDGLGPYRSGWLGLAQLVPGTSTASMTALKVASATWTDDGLHHDTIAHTWARRAELVGAPVTLERVYGTKKLPMLGTFPNGFPEYCVELRDSETGANYLPACVTYVNADSAPACADEGCADSMLSRFVWVRGRVEQDSRVTGGYKIAVSGSVRPRDANPNPL